MKFRHIAVMLVSFLLTVTSTYADVFTFVPRLSVSGEFTDNRNLEYTDEIEEYSTIISPGFDHSRTTRHNNLNISYTAGYVAYKKTDDDNLWRHNGSLSFSSELSKHTRLNIRDEYLQTDEPLLRENRGNDSPLTEDLSIRTGRYEYATNGASLNLTHQFGKEDSVYLSYLHRMREEFDIEGGNDYRQHTPSIGLAYWLTPQFGFDLSGDYTRGIYENSDDYDDWSGSLSLHRKMTKHFSTYLAYKQTMRRYDIDEDSNYNSYKPSAGIAYDVEKDISLSLGGGYFIKNYESGRRKSESFFIDGSVDKSWLFSRGEARLTGFAGLDTDDTGTEILGFNRNYGLDFTTTYGLTKYIEANVGAYFRRNDYLESKDNRADNRLQASCGLTYSAFRWLFINADYDFNMLRSSIDTNEYDENRFTLSVSAIPRGFRHVY